MIETLEQTPYLLPALLDRVKELVWLREPSGRIVYVNQAMEVGLGVPREELLADPKSFLRHVAPEDRAAVVAAGRTAAERAVTVEVEIRVPGQETRWLLSRVGPLHDAAGELIAIVGLGQDITADVRSREWRERLARVESERDEAKEGRHTLRAILDRITDGFVAIDAEWRFLYVNRQFEEIMEVDRDHVIGRPVFEIYPEMEGTIFHEQYRRAMREDCTVRFEAYFDPLGSWFDVHAYPSPEGLSIFFQDVTDKRRLEMELVEAVSKERQRVGAELHDSVGQKLTGAALLVRALEAQAAEGQAIRPEELSAVGAVLTSTVSETRRISRGLFPAELDGETIAAALESLGEDIEDLFGVSCRIAASSGVALDSDVELHLLRIAQELITNAVKHGGATDLSIEIRSSGTAVELVVTHDGRGPPRSEAERYGLGLRSIEYRVQAVGASIETAETPEGRTRTICRVPGS